MAALLLSAAALTGLLVTGHGEAQDQAPAAFAAPPTFADVVEQVSPAVVTVAVVKEAMAYRTSSSGNPSPGQPFDDFFRPFEGPGNLVPVPQPTQGVGSGFVISPDGYIATNNHVVEGASGLKVILASGEELAAEVVGRDSRSDLALIKVEHDEPLPALRFGDSDRTRVGDWVLAIGNPFGLGGSATAGIVSARGRNINADYAGLYDDFLQIDAAINSGNSGGPVFNPAGEVIGINTAIFSPTGGNVGIGFAIPANQAEAVLTEIREQGGVSRGWLGISMLPLEEDDKRVVVESVETGGPAAAAGIEPGDVITHFNGTAVNSSRALAMQVGELDRGDEVEIDVLRDGEPASLTARLGMRDEASLRAAAEGQRMPMPLPEWRYQTPNRNFGR
jgi:serine protease Do